MEKMFKDAKKQKKGGKFTFCLTAHLQPLLTYWSFLSRISSICLLFLYLFPYVCIHVAGEI